MENKVLNILEFDKVLTYLSENAISELGKQRCLDVKIFDNVQKIKDEILLTTQARNILDKGIFLPLTNIFDIKSSLSDAKNQMRLGEDEIYHIAETLKNSRIMKNFLSKLENEYSHIKKTTLLLYSNKEFEDSIFEIFDSAGHIKENATPELKSLNQTLRATQNNIKTTISKLLQNSDFTANLQDTIYTQRDGRTVFQVKSECKNKISGIVHDVSASNQTYFIEPKELVTINNKLRETEVLINAEIDRLLRRISNEIAKHYNDIESAFKQLIELDFIFAKAKYSIKLKAVPPEISPDRKIILKGMKNPVLIRAKDEIVENDFYLTEDKNCMIITGANTGGKTVTIKTVGLSLLMAKAGLHVPCYEAKIFPFKKLFADIGDEQSIIQSLSTFSSHMTNIVNVVNSCDENSLILLDEIAAGTDPSEGSSLAQAILEYIQQKGAFCIVTTHYGELKSLEYSKNGFVNASVEFNINSLSPTYKLLIGIPGSSNAIAIAKNLGLKEEIITQAKETHLTQKDTTAEILTKLQNTHYELSALTKSAQESEKKAKLTEIELNEKLKKINSSQKDTLLKLKQKYQTEISEAKKEIKEIVKEMRKAKSEKVAQRSFERLSKIENKLNGNMAEDEMQYTDTYKLLDWTKVKVGDVVMIKDLHQKVTILKMPDKNKNVETMMGNIKYKVKIDKLVAVDNSLVYKSNAPQISIKQNFSLRGERISSTLDLRGYTCEEALDALDKYLDKASLVNLSTVSIIHGHGTGALKKVVREYLSDSPYVAKFRAGESSEGGDGVSIVDVN